MAESIKPKAAASAVGGALVTTVVALTAQYADFDPEPAVVAGMTTLAAFALAWLVPDSAWRRAYPKSDDPSEDATEDAQ